MANWQDPQTTGVNAATVGVPRAARDVGLRSYMLSVYNYMASGVLLTGIVALLFAPYAAQVLMSPNGGMSMLGWIVTLSPLGFVFATGTVDGRALDVDDMLVPQLRFHVALS